MSARWRNPTERSAEAAERLARESPAGTAPPLPAGTKPSPARVLRPVTERLATSAGARFPGTSPVGATELWIGVHLTESADPRPARALERLALSAQRFTPRVSLMPPDGLVLEVKGSLPLFNGLESLSRALASECTSLGLKSRVAVAPTPLAALVAARVSKPGRSMGQPGESAGPTFVVTDPTRLVGQLMPLPLAALRWSQETLERLARIGVRTIGQVLRLPRAGFARRFGTDSLATLDRLTGRSPDPHERFRARERFRRRRELGYELENQAAILAALTPLLEELGKFLQARQCGVMKLECLLRHRRAEPTSCVLRLASPVADIGRLTALLGERLNAMTLPEPVRACELRSSSLVSRVLASNSVWQPGEYGGGVGEQATELIERLRARLGPEAVYGLKVLAGHRPENEWATREPVSVEKRNTLAPTDRAVPGGVTRPAIHGRRSGRDGAPRPRPLWLLPQPKRLSERDGLPRRRGPLRLLSEAERIETGWWDGGEIARDYFTAVDLHGVRLWVFRERNAPHRWFLHGVFG